MTERRSEAVPWTAGVCLLLVLWAAFPLAADAPDLTWLDGTWVGTGHQLGNTDEWSIEVTADSTTSRFEVSYASIGCGGTWELTRAGDGIAWFTESVAEGTDICVDGGTVAVVRISDAFIAYSFFYPDAKTLDSFSTLERQ
jgi:hypothetical protein